ncbi:hypothetical protein PHYPSEUDO_011582 [Phytophthora pseudosyringae]|uniref:Uncharacterized protein n=1 Tax=Phytophthora pseudosyringae TaxID=221518 RepID=A0A8T1W6E1_9STRA|nr:hypothetical protein PHYPSEUDO_011582 [Phytophthora pseudosyringae]
MFQPTARFYRVSASEKQEAPRLDETRAEKVTLRGHAVCSSEACAVQWLPSPAMSSLEQLEDDDTELVELFSEDKSDLEVNTVRLDLTLQVVTNTLKLMVSDASVSWSEWLVCAPSYDLGNASF